MAIPITSTPDSSSIAVQALSIMLFATVVSDPGSEAVSEADEFQVWAVFLKIQYPAT